jgi:3-oxoacyl-[acyl-carrier-protein] synthase II
MELRSAATVLITGIGAVTPGGHTSAQTWRSVVDNQVSITAVKRFPTYSSSSRIAGMVPGHEFAMPPESLSLEYGLAAAGEALARAGLT